MNWLDLVLLTILGLSVASGLWKGFTKLAIGLAATILGVISALWFYSSVGAGLESWLKLSRGVANCLGFFVILIGFQLAGALVSYLIGRLLRLVGLSWLDRLAGAAFGFLRGVVVGIALVMALLAFSATKPPQAIVDSRYAPYFIDAARWITVLAPRDLKDAVQDGYQKVRDVLEKGIGKPVEKQR